MNNIGIGIFCFGDEFYYSGTIVKLNNLFAHGFHCYVLTDNPQYFTEKYYNNQLHIINYDRTFRSYHDKMILPKHILKNHDYCALIDADLHINDFSIIDVLKTYEFKYGITYINTLKNHRSNREFVKDLMGDGPEWDSYKVFAEKLCPSYKEFETIWENFMVINKIGFKQNQFYDYYEKLQISKEFSDLYINKKVSGAGEGVSLAISAKLSGCDIQRDETLYEIIKDKILDVSRNFTRPEFWPDFMK
jgi:hypothetical protein